MYNAFYNAPICSSVGIGTNYEMDGPGSNSVGDEIFRQSRSALWPTQIPLKWGVLLTTQPLLVPQSWKSRVIPLPILWTTRGL